MDLLTKETLSILLQTRGVCASIYLPTHPRGVETLQDPIRLKNLLESAETQMISGGGTRKETKEALEPARRLIRDLPSLRSKDDGVAIFVCGEFFHCLRLPIRFRELAVVARRFHIKPLLPLLSGDGHFYLLAISENHVRVFQGTRYTIAELQNEHLPANLREALQYENFERQLQLHTAGSSGGRVAIHHGHTAAIEDNNQRRLRYFRQIDAGLRSLVPQNRAPLVLAGVEDLFPVYRLANTHPVLLERGIPGNQDRASGDELHAAAWDIVEPHFAHEKTAALNNYQDLSGTRRTSHGLNEILPCLSQGRVEQLFIKADVEIWGTFDPDRNEVSPHVNPEPGDEDLLDLAAVQAILHGAAVYALPSGEMPEGRDIAALFRY